MITFGKRTVRPTQAAASCGEKKNKRSPEQAEGSREQMSGTWKG